MRKRIFTWLGKEFIELSGEAKAAANATIEAQELFQRIDQELKRFITTNYDRARSTLEKHRVALDRIAEELLAREVLDADQVRRIVAGEALEEYRAPATAAQSDDSRRQPKERPSIVPPLPPLNKPLPQE